MDIDTLPKLLPMWNDLSINYTMTVNKNKKFTKDKLPDFGGAGIDLCENSDDTYECDVIKNSVNQVNFGAQVCALPFIPPNTTLWTDPCLKPQLSIKSKTENFCLKIDLMRRSLNKPSFQKQIKSSYKLLSHTSTKSGISSTVQKQFMRNSSKWKRNITKLAEEFPRTLSPSDANFAFAGGCLTTSKSLGGRKVLLHTTGKKLHKLVLSELEESDEMCKHFKKQKENVIKLKKGSIHQIETEIDGFCYVRQENLCHFVNYADLDNIGHIKCSNLKNVTYVSPSPYYPMELLSSDNNSIIQLYDTELRQTIWMSNKLNNSRDDTSIVCDFGSQPRSVLCFTDSNLYQFDLRIKGTRESTLFSTTHYSCYPKEIFCSLKRLPTNPFQSFVATNNHAYVLDERYPLKPVLIWNHLLKGYPLYSDIAPYESSQDHYDLVALLGIQESSKLASFTIRSDSSKLHPISLSLPMFLSSSTDFADSLKLHCIHVDEGVTTRLNQPLVGVGLMPHSSNSGFTAFQMTSLGDIFYQDFRKILRADVEKTYSVGPGCVVAPPSRIQPLVGEWMSSCVMPKSPSDREEILVGLKDVVSSVQNSTQNQCLFCNPDSAINKKDVSPDTTCLSCGLSETDANNLRIAFNGEGLLQCPEKESDELNFDPLSLLKYKDDFSQKLSQIWLSSDGDEIDMENSYSDSAAILFSQSNDSRMTQNSNSLLTMDEERNNSIHWEPIGEEYSDDIIPPSQVILPIIGETMRMPRISLNKSQLSTAGF